MPPRLLRSSLRHASSSSLQGPELLLCTHVSQFSMAALGTATTPAAAAAAAPAAPRCYNRRPRWHHVVARRNRVASARRLDLCASASLSPAVTAPDISDESVAKPLVEPAPETKLGKLACPICYYPLASSSDQSDDASSLECSTCKKSYPNKQDYWDLTVSVGTTEYSESMPAGTELFRTPLVSFLYERGWRQNFIWGGFPGVEKEFEMAKTYLKPTFGGTIVDASCGSGLFSRLFVKSGLYSLVVALDFSENMLKQCNEYIKQENISDERLELVRADISRLPFMSGSIDAVHAGAAIHCWPSPACAVADISRVLRPGGIFVASTFVADVIPPAIPVLSIGRPPAAAPSIPSVIQSPTPTPFPVRLRLFPQRCRTEDGRTRRPGLPAAAPCLLPLAHISCCGAAGDLPLAVLPTTCS